MTLFVNYQITSFKDTYCWLRSLAYFPKYLSTMHVKYVVKFFWKFFCVIYSTCILQKYISQFLPMLCSPTPHAHTPIRREYLCRDFQSKWCMCSGSHGRGSICPVSDNWLTCQSLASSKITRSPGDTYKWSSTPWTFHQTAALQRLTAVHCSATENNSRVVKKLLSLSIRCKRRHFGRISLANCFAENQNWVFFILFYFMRSQTGVYWWGKNKYVAILVVILLCVFVLSTVFLSPC